MLDALTGAHTAKVLVEYMRLWEMLDDVQLSQANLDKIIWRWTMGGEYSSSLAYHAFFIGAIPLLGAEELWRASAPPKVKFFFRLALHGRIWTAVCRVHHGLQPMAECALYDMDDETFDHLLSSCAFT
jgi:hypothetical protein